MKKPNLIQRVANILHRLFDKAKADELVCEPPHNLNFPGPTYQETEVIREYHSNAGRQLLGDTVEDIVNWVLKTAMNKLTNSMLPSQIYDILMKGNQPDQLSEIIKSLDSIERKIDELSAKTTMFKYEDVINARNNYVSKMANAQIETNIRLQAADPNDADLVSGILKNWADGTQIDGNSTLAHYMNFIDFITDNTNDGMTLYDIYDKYVYLTTPWENMGYKFREDIRLADFSVIATQARLAILHYAYNEDNEQVRGAMIDRIKSALNKYGDYYDKHRVVRRDDMAICQIPSCKLEMSRTLEHRDYKGHPWFNNETYWYTPDYQESRPIGEFEGSIYDLTFNPNKESTYKAALTEAEVNTMKQYYNGKYSSLLQMLKDDANCVCSCAYSSANAMLVVQGKPYIESAGWDNGNWYVTVRGVKMSSEFGCGWWRVGEAWLKRYGLFWAKRMFMWWDTYYADNTWFIAKVSKRL